MKTTSLLTRVLSLLVLVGVLSAGWAQAQLSPLGWFSDNYYMTESNSFTEGYDYGTVEFTWSKYQNASNDWVTIFHEVASWAPENPYTVIEGYDLYVGSWSLSSGDLTNPFFNERSTPKFAPLTFWVNGKLVNWASSTIDSSGGIVDYFVGDGGNLTMQLSANVKNYETGYHGVDVWINNAWLGSIYKQEAGIAIYTAAFDIQLSGPNSTTPLFVSDKLILYVDGTPYDFMGGYEDAAGHRTDLYGNAGNWVRLVGHVSNPSVAGVKANVNGMGYGSGTWADGVFTLAGLTIIPDPLVRPAALWVGGVFCPHALGTTQYVSADNSTTLTMSGTEPTALSLTGTYGYTGYTFTGSFNTAVGGTFFLSTADQSLLLACAAHADGTLSAGAAGPAIGVTLPSAVRVEDQVWPFIGMANNAGTELACYGWAQAPGDGYSPVMRVLTIPSEGANERAATLKDWITGGVQTGVFHLDSHLFQATDQSAGLPRPVYAVNPNDSNANWFLDPPAGLPPSFIIRDQPWWFAGEDGAGNAIYRGFYEGQSMLLGPSVIMPDGSTGERLVTLTDRIQNGNDSTTNGTLSNLRGSVRLRDGTLVLSGNAGGGQQTVAHTDDYKLHTIASDVDIIGNNLSFGLLQNDASLAAVLFSFADTNARPGSIATLHNTLSRAQAEWVWSRAADATAQTTLEVMKLDMDHQLKLFPTGGGAAGIILNPNGGSSFKGPVRVLPAGDVPMAAEFQNGPQP